MSLGDQIVVLANLIVAVAAAVALYIGWRQIKISRELSAIAAYENHLALCLQYPRYSTGQIRFEDLSVEDLDGYIVFVHYVLTTGERIYSIFPNDKGWALAIEQDIRLHRRFIASKHFTNRLKYKTWRINTIIERVLNEPECDGSAGPGAVTQGGPNR
jgi:hypothetical protein